MVGARLRTPQDLGAAIRDARIARSLTQADLARDAGVSREWLIGIEQGQRPRAELAKILAVLDTLGLPLYAGVPSEPPGPESSPAGAPPGETRTEMATRKAIESFRTTAQVPALVEHGSRAARLLDAGLDPGLVAHLARISMDLAPPATPGDGGDAREDEEEHPS